MLAPATLALTVSGGDICETTGPRDIQLLTTLSKGRLLTRAAEVFTVVALASTERMRPRESTFATSTQPGKKVLVNATVFGSRRWRMMLGISPEPGATSA